MINQQAKTVTYPKGKVESWEARSGAQGKMASNGNGNPRMPRRNEHMQRVAERVVKAKSGR
jgi:hypothetical protein